MTEIKTIGGQDLKDMFSAAANWLEKSAPDINALNVFPVPDGDCGTNMLLTMRTGIEHAEHASVQSIATVAQAIAKGTLLGARGNSGVILSQIWRGIALSLENKDTINSDEFADALTSASDTAYKGLTNPVEGTILTVVRESAEAAHKASNGNKDIVNMLEATVSAASESVSNTPTLLEALRDAGVVDAGGQGFFTLMEGALLYLKGDAQLMQFRKSRVITSSIPLTAKVPQLSQEDEIPFGYCTEFLLKGEGLEPEKMKRKLLKKGECLIVVGDDTTVRVHIHTLDPGEIIHYGTTLGTVNSVSIRNMDEQHEDFLALQKDRTPTMDVAIVAVVAGDGLADVFTSLGASAIVAGGQTMNPSTKDILQKVEAVASGKIIILPNNKNIVLTARQVESLTEKQVIVIPTETVPQGTAALLAFDYEADFETNARLMEEAISSVTTIEITQATRSAKLDGLSIKKKQAIGLIDGKILAVAEKPADVLHEVLARIDLEKAEVITVYFGGETTKEEAKLVAADIRTQRPEIQVEVVDGSQPHYNYIVSIE